MKPTKPIQKPLMFLLSGMLALCLSPLTAFAEQSTGPTFTPGKETGSLTINKTDGAGNAITDPNLEYTIYKVANIVQTSASSVVSVNYILLNGIEVKNGSDTLIGDGATTALPEGTKAEDFVKSSLGAAVQSVANTEEDGTLVFSDLPLGLYLVIETVTPAGAALSNDFLVSIPMSISSGNMNVWEYDVVAEPKNTVFDGKVRKDITGGTLVVGEDRADKVYTASLGETIAYTITATLPTTFEETPYTTYTIADTPDAALVIDVDSIEVKVGATTLAEGIDFAFVTLDPSGFSIELIMDPPTGTAPGTQSAHLINSAEVVITYDAVLSPDASGNTFENAVEIEYAYNTDGDPVEPDEPIVPDPDNPLPIVKTYDFALQKVDGDNGNDPLEGATFAIMDTTGKYLTWDEDDGWGISNDLAGAFTVTSEASDDAIVFFRGLKEGSYQIVETEAPDGYTQLKDAIAVTIDSVTTTAALSGYSIQVVNSLANLFELPGTGGFGIYAFTIGGLLLIVGAAILYVKSRKKREKRG